MPPGISMATRSARLWNCAGATVRPFARVQLPQPLAEDSEPHGCIRRFSTVACRSWGAAFSSGGASGRRGLHSAQLRSDRALPARQAHGRHACDDSRDVSTSNLIADVEVFDESGRFLAGVEGMQPGA